MAREISGINERGGFFMRRFLGLASGGGGAG